MTSPIEVAFPLIRKFGVVKVWPVNVRIEDGHLAAKQTMLATIEIPDYLSARIKINEYRPDVDLGLELWLRFYVLLRQKGDGFAELLAKGGPAAETAVTLVCDGMQPGLAVQCAGALEES
jgi:hypothetical protein